MDSFIYIFHSSIHSSFSCFVHWCFAWSRKRSFLDRVPIFSDSYVEVNLQDFYEIEFRLPVGEAKRYTRCLFSSWLVFCYTYDLTYLWLHTFYFFFLFFAHARSSFCNVCQVSGRQDSPRFRLWTKDYCSGIWWDCCQVWRQGRIASKSSRTSEYPQNFFTKNWDTQKGF